MTKIEQFREEIKANIKSAVSKAKKDGITSMSIECLMQNTRTPKLCVPAMTPSIYREVFESVALQSVPGYLIRD